MTSNHMDHVDFLLSPAMVAWLPTFVDLDFILNELLTKWNTLIVRYIYEVT